MPEAGPDSSAMLSQRGPSRYREATSASSIITPSTRPTVGAQFHEPTSSPLRFPAIGRTESIAAYGSCGKTTCARSPGLSKT